MDDQPSMFLAPSLWPTVYITLHYYTYITRRRTRENFVSELQVLCKVVISIAYLGLHRVGIDLKELGCQLAKCLKFCPGIEI